MTRSLHPRRLFQTLTLLAATLAIAACVDSKQTVTLNPDGSGKSAFDVTLAAPPALRPNPGTQPAAAPDPQLAAHNAVTGFLRQSTGVSAWSNLAFQPLPDGRLHLTGTAYFADINTFKLGPNAPVKWTPDTKILEIGDRRTEAYAASRPKPPELTDEQVQQKVAQNQKEFRQMKPMVSAMFKNLRLDTTYQLPGKIAAANIFTKTSDSSVQLVIEGQKFLDAMDALNSDEKLTADMIRAGKKMDNSPDIFTEKLFGQKGPISATLAGDLKSQFDYKSEQETAKAAQDDMLAKLNLNLTPKPFIGPGTPPPATAPHP